MKKLVLFFGITIMFVAFLGSQMVRAESYQRWITFDQPGHIMTANELADITGALGRNEISSGTYRLSTGVTYKIPQPNLFLQYIVMCVKEGEPSIITMDDVVREIQNGEVVRWGNDISVKVRNYYFSSLHSRVQFIDNYSGNNVDGVFVLLIHGNPKIKMDCGNPLWVIGGEKIPPQNIPDKFILEQKVKISSFNFPEDLGGSIVVKQVPNLYFPPVPKERGRIKVWVFVIPLAAIIGGGIYLLTKKKNSSPMDNGGPGGAPVTRPVVPPPVIPPVVPGGPGGAPTTP